MGKINHPVAHLPAIAGKKTPPAMEIRRVKKLFAPDMLRGLVRQDETGQTGIHPVVVNPAERALQQPVRLITDDRRPAGRAALLNGQLHPIFRFSFKLTPRRQANGDEAAQGVR
jgi:hypothetical protein